MTLMLRISRSIDRLLKLLAVLGGWSIVMLIIVVCYDVATRYAGITKVFDLTSTKLQESEYWLHSYAIVFVVGFAYVRQSHVRIDLLRERCSTKIRFWIEAIGCGLLLLPYSVLGIWFSIPYAHRSWVSGEISKSQTGLTNLWLLKSGLVILYVLLGLSAISVMIKAIAGITGHLPRNLYHETLGGDNV